MDWVQQLLIAVVPAGIAYCAAKITNDRKIASEEQRFEKAMKREVANKAAEYQGELNRLTQAHEDRIAELTRQAADNRQLKLIEYAVDVEGRLRAYLVELWTEAGAFVETGALPDCKKVLKLRWDIWSIMSPTSCSLTALPADDEYMALKHQVLDAAERIIAACMRGDRPACRRAYADQLALGGAAQNQPTTPMIAVTNLFARIRKDIAVLCTRQIADLSP